MDFLHTCRSEDADARADGPRGMAEEPMEGAGSAGCLSLMRRRGTDEESSRSVLMGLMSKRLWENCVLVRVFHVGLPPLAHHTTQP